MQPKGKTYLDQRFQATGGHHVPFKAYPVLDFKPPLSSPLPPTTPSPPPTNGWGTINTSKQPLPVTGLSWLAYSAPYPKLQLSGWAALLYTILAMPVSWLRLPIFVGSSSPLSHLLTSQGSVWSCSLWLSQMSLPLGCSPFYLQQTFSSAMPRSSHDIALLLSSFFYFFHSSGTETQDQSELFLFISLFIHSEIHMLQVDPADLLPPSNNAFQFWTHQWINSLISMHDLITFSDRIHKLRISPSTWEPLWRHVISVPKHTQNSLSSLLL